MCPWWEIRKDDILNHCEAVPHGTKIMDAGKRCGFSCLWIGKANISNFPSKFWSNGWSSCYLGWGSYMRTWEWGFMLSRHSMAHILVQMTSRVLVIGTPGLQNFYSLYPFFFSQGSIVTCLPECTGSMNNMHWGWICWCPYEADLSSNF